MPRVRSPTCLGLPWRPAPGGPALETRRTSCPLCNRVPAPPRVPPRCARGSARARTRPAEHQAPSDCEPSALETHASRSACVPNKGLGNGRFHGLSGVPPCTLFRFIPFRILRSPNVGLKEESQRGLSPGRRALLDALRERNPPTCGNLTPLVNGAWWTLTRHR